MSVHLFAAVLQKQGLPLFHPEYAFAKPRRWRFDYAWPDLKIALEVEGGAFSGGRHTRGAGFRNDLEKYNAATSAGWRVFRVLPEQLLTHGVDLVKQAIQR